MNPRETAPIGGSPLKVTRLGLGTAPLGGLYAPVAHEDALRTIDAAWDAGVRFFDTAPLYGHGLAEMRLGEALALPRDSYVIATKVGRLLRPVARGALEDRHYKGTPSPRTALRLLVRRRDEIGRREPRPAKARSRRPSPHPRSRRSLRGCYRRRVSRAREAAARRRDRRRRCRDEPVADAAASCRGRALRLLPARRPLHAARSLGGGNLLSLCAQKSISIIAGGVYNSGILADPHEGAKFNYEAAPAELLARARR